MNDERKTDVADIDRVHAASGTVPPESGTYASMTVEGADALCARAVRAFDRSIGLPDDLGESLIRSLERLRPVTPPGPGAPSRTGAPSVLASNASPSRKRASSLMYGAVTLAAATALLAVIGEAPRGVTASYDELRDPGQSAHPSTPPRPVSGGVGAPVRPAPVEAPAVAVSAPGRGDAPRWLAKKADLPPASAPRDTAAGAADPGDAPHAGMAPPSLPPPMAGARATPAEAGRMLDAARAAYVEGAPARALDALDACGQACRQGPLEEDAMALKVQALAAIGNPIAARALGESFLDAYPHSVHVPAIHATLGGRPGIVVASNDTPPEDGWGSAGLAAMFAIYDPTPENGWEGAGIVQAPTTRSGDPATDGPETWGLLGTPGSVEVGAIALDDIGSVEPVGGGSLRVVAVAYEVGELSGRAPERLALLFDRAGKLVDVSPVSCVAQAE